MSSDLRITMDPHSRDIERDGQVIGALQWHPSREPRIVLHDAQQHLTLAETRAVLERYSLIQTCERIAGV